MASPALAREIAAMTDGCTPAWLSLPKLLWVGFSTGQSLAKAPGRPAPRAGLAPARRAEARRHRAQDPLEVVQRGELAHDLAFALAELDLHPGLEAVRQPAREILHAR